MICKRIATVSVLVLAMALCAGPALAQRGPLAPMPRVITPPVDQATDFKAVLSRVGLTFVDFTKLLAIAGNRQRQLQETADELLVEAQNKLIDILDGDARALVENFIDNVEDVGPDLAFLELTAGQKVKIKRLIGEYHEKADAGENRNAEWTARREFSAAVHELLEAEQTDLLAKVSAARSGQAMAPRMWPTGRSMVQLTKILDIDVEKRILVGQTSPQVARVSFMLAGTLVLVDGKQVTADKLIDGKRVVVLYDNVASTYAGALVQDSRKALSVVHGTLATVADGKLTLAHALAPAMTFTDDTLFISGGKVVAAADVKAGCEVSIVVGFQTSVIDRTVPPATLVVYLSPAGQVGQKTTSGLLVRKYVPQANFAGRGGYGSVELAGSLGDQVTFKVADDFTVSSWGRGRRENLTLDELKARIAENPAGIIGYYTKDPDADIQTLTGGSLRASWGGRPVPMAGGRRGDGERPEQMRVFRRQVQ